jgi:hypothetical protein
VACCIHLGPATGRRVKSHCSDRRGIGVYECLHPDRRRATRSGKDRPGLCTPAADTVERDVIPWCRRCPLREV